MEYSRAIHWFRRDLRLTDNTALLRASRESAEVIPVYISSPWSGEHLWTGPVRQTFLCDCLASLATDLGASEGRLIHRRGPALSTMAELLKETRAEALFFNCDPDPFGWKTEADMEALCRELNIAFVPCHDHALHAPAEIRKPDNTPYRVYTPYYRRWIDAEKRSFQKERISLRTPSAVESLPPPSLADWSLPAPAANALPAGEEAARHRLTHALAKRMPRYELRRDMLGVEGTSRLSQDLRFGTISIREVFWSAHEAKQKQAEPAERASFDKFIAELAWREFYMQILTHFPEVLELEFNPDWRGLPWDEPDHKFECWKTGTTGFPVVDAAMRELAATGFMHNRARMIVAMFLTKDLHLDWRLGEQFFMQSLRDGEIASNNGGWQWSAGTGADAAPYFRIQNPWTQSKRYDPEGAYIRQWIPELAQVASADFFKPPPAGQSLAPGYPAPILDHSAERQETLQRFKRHAAQRPR